MSRIIDPGEKPAILKEKRHEMYQKINQYVGPMDAKTQAFLSDMIKEYAKLHNNLLTEEKNALAKKIEELKGLLNRKRPQRTSYYKKIY